MKGFTSFFSGVTSNVQQKLGGHSQASSAAAAHKIVDKEFDKEKENLKSFVGEAHDVVKALQTQNRAIKTWLVDPMKDLDAGLCQFYGESHSVYLAFQKVCVNMQSCSLVFAEEQDAALAHMNECLDAAAKLKKAVADRDAKVAEVDRACVQVFQLQGGRDVSKAQTAMTRYKTLKAEYDKQNADTLYQIRAFLHQRPERFDAHFKAAMVSWDKFFEAGAALFASLESLGVAAAAADGVRLPALPVPAPSASGAAPPLPPKPAAGSPVDLLSSDAPTAASEPASAPAPAPEPTTAKSRVEKFGVRMLPVVPGARAAPSPDPAEPAAAAPASSASSPDKAANAPPPLPPKPSAPDAI